MGISDRVQKIPGSELEKVMNTPGQIMRDYRTEYELEAVRLETEKMKMQIEQAKMAASYDMAQMANNRTSNPAIAGYTLNIRPGVNGGYAVSYEGELYIAASIEALPEVIIAAIAKKKIKG